MTLFFSKDTGEKEKGKLHKKKPNKILVSFCKKSLEYPLKKRCTIMYFFWFASFKISLEIHL